MYAAYTRTSLVHRTCIARIYRLKKIPRRRRQWLWYYMQWHVMTTFGISDGRIHYYSAVNAKSLKWTSWVPEKLQLTNGRTVCPITSVLMLIRRTAIIGVLFFSHTFQNQSNLSLCVTCRTNSRYYHFIFFFFNKPLLWLFKHSM